MKPPASPRATGCQRRSAAAGPPPRGLHNARWQGHVNESARTQCRASVQQVTPPAHPCTAVHSLCSSTNVLPSPGSHPNQSCLVYPPNEACQPESETHEQPASQRGSKAQQRHAAVGALAHGPTRSDKSGLFWAAKHKGCRPGKVQQLVCRSACGDAAAPRGCRKREQSGCSLL